MFRNFLTNVKEVAGLAAPLIGAGAALSTGGQAATLSRIATASNILGGQQQGQSVAVDRAQQPASETASSGESTAGVTNIIATQPTSGGIVPASYGMNVPTQPRAPTVQRTGLPAIITGGTTITRGALNLLGIAGGAAMVAPIIIDPITGEEKKLRVTRKLKASVRKAVEMFGVEFVAGQMGVEVEVIFYILTKRMRNDGPAITKAALRKTRSTMRKLDAMCDMRDKMRPPARRATRARTTSKVMQIKN